MRQLVTTADLQKELSLHREERTGMVPTMGALHTGHTSLVERSVKENDITVVSIFVNPTQFNDAGDLEKYPRTLDADLAILSSILGDSDIVFTPEAEDIYRGESSVVVDLGHLDSIMEGAHRPGHFVGVVRIVKILFDLCRPDRAYFGLKDYQQLAVIKTLIKQTGMATEIIPCPIIREANGLAMSSRNSRLSADMRARAGIIYKTLRKVSVQVVPPDIDALKEQVRDEINREKGFRVEYFEIVDDDLRPLLKTSHIRHDMNYRACIAVYAGDVRLIDNINFCFQFHKG